MIFSFVERDLTKGLEFDVGTREVLCLGAATRSLTSISPPAGGRAMAKRSARCTPTDRSVSSIRARLVVGGGDNPSLPPHAHSLSRPPRALVRALFQREGSVGHGGRGTGSPRSYVHFPVSNPFVRLCLCHWASVSVRKTFLSLVSFRFTVHSAHARTKSLLLLL